MFGALEIINPSGFQKAVSRLESDKRHYSHLSSKDFLFRQVKTEPLAGFSFPDNWPYCCESHRKIFNDSLDHFKNFPNCCEWHRKLLKAKWFNKTDYAYFPIKLLLTCTYTSHCIQTSIDDIGWYNRITDYIEYTYYSYGQLPEGHGSALGQHRYISIVKNTLVELKSIPRFKKEKIIAFIDELDKGADDHSAELVDINYLIDLYDEWLKIFPFEIEFFRNVRVFFEGKRIIFKGPATINMYTNVSRRQTLTIQEMVELLTVMTKMLLRELNSVKWFEMGLLVNPDQLQIDILVAKRTLCLKKYDTLSSISGSYITLLSEWLQDEKDFLEEIIPVIRRKVEGPSFIDRILDGVLEVQKQDVNIPAIRDIKGNGKKDESGFRYAMKMFLKGAYPNSVISAEEEKGTGRIDLKVTEATIGEKIIEFKGWWNDDKKVVAQQICSYLTDANQDGYIFIINHHSDKSISEQYRDLIMSETTGCSDWQALTYRDTALTYYKSIHQFPNSTKVLFHVILNVYSSIERNKKGR